MKLMDWIKWIFPKPQLPQKRYWVMAGIALYCAAKVYVAYTPTPDDDKYPDQLRGIIVDYFADADKEPDPSSDYDEDGLRFGEGS